MPCCNIGMAGTHWWLTMPDCHLTVDKYRACNHWRVATLVWTAPRSAGSEGFCLLCRGEWLWAGRWCRSGQVERIRREGGVVLWLTTLEALQTVGFGDCWLAEDGCEVFLWSGKCSSECGVRFRNRVHVKWLTGVTRTGLST